MDKQQVIYKDLGIIDYKSAWDYQEELVARNLEIKSELRKQLTIDNERLAIDNGQSSMVNREGTIMNNQFSILNSQSSILHNQPTNYKLQTTNSQTLNPKPQTLNLKQTTNYLLFCEHPPVYTLGKSGSMDNVLLSEKEMDEKEIEFFKTNRGGDITFHGLQQIVGYPILDLENFYTDIGKYLRNLEELIVKTIAEYGIIGERSKGETGVWIEPGVKGRERKICAMGIRCSRWITMHGFALNVNTDLGYFENIIPCGIQNKQVTSMQKELNQKINFEEVKQKLKINFEEIFGTEII